MFPRALITLQTQTWIGQHDGYAIVTTAQLWTSKGQILTPVTLGGRKSDYEGVEFLFYEVLVERIVPDRVSFTYQKLVVANPDGTLNLSAPNTGRFILRAGETVRLGAPVMDGGPNLTLTLDQIR